MNSAAAEFERVSTHTIPIVRKRRSLLFWKLNDFVFIILFNLTTIPFDFSNADNFVNDIRFYNFGIFRTILPQGNVLLEYPLLWDSCTSLDSLFLCNSPTRVFMIYKITGDVLIFLKSALINLDTASRTISGSLLVVFPSLRNDGGLRSIVTCYPVPYLSFPCCPVPYCAVPFRFVLFGSVPFCSVLFRSLPSRQLTYANGWWDRGAGNSGIWCLFWEITS